MAERNAPPGVTTGRTRRTAVEKIMLLKNRVETARRVRKDWQRKYSLEELYRYFYSDMSSLVMGAESSMMINKMMPTVKTVIPSLFLQNPTFVVRSMVENSDATSVLKAKMAEAALKAIADQEHHLEFSIRLAILQSFFSIGVLKTIYDPKMIKNPRAGEVMYQREPSGIPVVDPAGEPIEMEDDDGNPVVEPDTIVDDETYRWDWVNGDKMLLPDYGPNHLRWPWIAEEVTVLLEDAREDERFPENLRTQLKSNTAALEDSDDMFIPITAEDQMSEHKDDYITYVEFWDIRKKRQLIWVEGQTFSNTQLLIDRQIPVAIENHPYPLLLGYTPIIAPKSCPWPMPYVYNWLPLQKEHESRRRQLSVGAKRTARKIFYEDGSFENENDAIGFLQSSEDMQGVKVSSLDRLPQVHADPILPQNIAQDMNLLEADWAFETGVMGSRTGGRNRGTDSVYDSKVAVSAAEMRDLDMRHAVNVFLESSGKKMLRMLKATMTLSMYVRLRGTSDTHYKTYVAKVYGPEVAQNLEQFPNLRYAFDEHFGENKWLELGPEDLDFEATVTVAPGSARSRTMESEKQDFFQILQVLSSAPILTQSRALLNRIADMFEFFDVSMIDEILAASERANQLEQMKAGRMQGNDPGGGPPPQAAATGNGANISSFRRNFGPG